MCVVLAGTTCSSPAEIYNYVRTMGLFVYAMYMSCMCHACALHGYLNCHKRTVLSLCIYLSHSVSLSVCTLLFCCDYVDPILGERTPQCEWRKQNYNGSFQNRRPGKQSKDCGVLMDVTNSRKRACINRGAGTAPAGPASAGPINANFF